MPMHSIEDPSQTDFRQPPSSHPCDCSSHPTGRPTPSHLHAFARALLLVDVGNKHKCHFLCDASSCLLFFALITFTNFPTCL